MVAALARLQQDGLLRVGQCAVPLPLQGAQVAARPVGIAERGIEGHRSFRGSSGAGLTFQGELRIVEMVSHEAFGHCQY